VLRPAKGYEGKYDLTELRSVQDWIVRRQLLGTPGVADISSFGGYLKQYEIAIQPDRLKSMNITVADIFNALEKTTRTQEEPILKKVPMRFLSVQKALLQLLPTWKKYLYGIPQKASRFI